MIDDKHIALWLHGRPDTTAREYRREIEKLAITLDGRSLLEAKLVDLRSHGSADRTAVFNAAIEAARKEKGGG